MFKSVALVFLIFASITIKAQTCWQKTVMNDSIFVLQVKPQIPNDTLYVVVIKEVENPIDCKTLNEIRKLKESEIDNAITVLIARGLRVEIFRKEEIFR
jgi:hypothetical protein